jgi:hypothetical protein
MMGEADAEHIIEYGRTHQPQMSHAAVRDHVMNENPGACDKLVEQYWLDLPRLDPNSILTAQNAQQLQVRKEGRNGEISLVIPGVGRTT